MGNSVKEIISKIKSSDKKVKILFILGIIGVFLIVLSEISPPLSQSDSKQDGSYDKYVESLEKETKEIIRSIDGAGDCLVMITLKASSESVFAKNTDENHNSGSFSKSDEYVFYKQSNGETPVLVKEYFPQVSGVAVVCSGGDNYAVKESIINCLTSLFGIPSSKISVSKLKG